MKKTLLIVFSFYCLISTLHGQGNGLLIKDGKQLFPIGWYFLPEKNSELKELADAGINLINCDSKEGLDRVQAAGILGWVPLRMQDGVTEEFKKKVQSVASHPALAVWEGPDEVTWNFTAWSALYRKKKVHSIPDAWWAQTPEAIQYANEQAAIVVPNIQKAASYIRSVDPFNRQIWINEASRSDATFVRQYLDAIDITGCDKYPISDTLEPGNTKIRNSVESIGFVTERWNEVGRGKPVWMILQAFSWHEMGGQYSTRPIVYPSFIESRYMAYDAIAHGSKGIIYYGADYCNSKEFIQSIYALTSELSSLQPFLIAPEQNNITALALKGEDPAKQSIECIARQYSRNWMIVVINETDNYEMDVVVNGLKHLNGQKFSTLYGNEDVTVVDEEIITRMKPHEVKVFTTGKQWETKRLNGRDYHGR